MSKSLSKMDGSKQCHITCEMSFDDVNQFREMIARLRAFQLITGAHSDEMKDFGAQIRENKRRDIQAKCERPNDGGAKGVERLLRGTFKHVQRTQNISMGFLLAEREKRRKLRLRSLPSLPKKQDKLV